MTNIPKSFFQKRFREPCLLCFSRRSDLMVVSPKKSQDGAQGVKKLYFYGSEALTFSFGGWVGCVCKKAVKMRDAVVFYERGAVQKYCPPSKTKMERKGKKKQTSFRRRRSRSNF